MAIYFDDESVKPDAYYKYTNNLRDSKTPIIIDNGNFLNKFNSHFLNTTEM